MGRLFFQGGHPETGDELWMSDGESASLVQDVAPGQLSSSPTGMIEFNGRLYFAATEPSSVSFPPSELYSYDLAAVVRGDAVNATREPGTGRD